MSFNLILKELMTKNNVTNYRLAKDLGISKGTISNYLTGATLPQSSIRDKIMNYFNNDESLRDSSTIIDSTTIDPNNQIINNQNFDTMTLDAINRMLAIIEKQQDDIHLANLNVRMAMENQANLISRIPGGTESKKAM